MRIYLAGPWKRRHAMPAYASMVREAGHTVVSRWHDKWAQEPETTNVEVLRQEAQMDLDDVRRADVVIVFNLEKSEGKAVEQGFALAFGKTLIIVGELRFNVFQYLPYVQLVPTLQHALALLAPYADPIGGALAILVGGGLWFLIPYLVARAIVDLLFLLVFSL